MAEICGVLFDDQVHPCDPDGCLLPMGHAGPHEFKDEDGESWLWETDLSCECEHCMRAMGDYCAIYWRKADDERIAAAEAEYASWRHVGVRANSETSSTTSQQRNGGRA